MPCVRKIITGIKAGFTFYCVGPQADNCDIWGTVWGVQANLLTSAPLWHFIRQNLTLIFSNIIRKLFSERRSNFWYCWWRVMKTIVFTPPVVLFMAAALRLVRYYSFPRGHGNQNNKNKQVKRASVKLIDTMQYHMLSCFTICLSLV